MPNIADVLSKWQFIYVCMILFLGAEQRKYYQFIRIGSGRTDDIFGSKNNVHHYEQRIFRTSLAEIGKN